MVFRRGGDTPQYRPSNQESFVLPTRAALILFENKKNPVKRLTGFSLPARGLRHFYRSRGYPQGASVSLQYTNTENPSRRNDENKCPV